MGLPAQPVVVITGASSGVGRATAHAFATRGARLVLAARAERTLQDAAGECRDLAPDADVLVVPTDVSDTSALATLVERTTEHFGRIDVWVNAAAVMAYGRFCDIPPEVHRQVLATNLLAPIEATRAVLPILFAQGSGVIVNVASLYGRMTTPYVSPYATSKYGLRGFTQIVRRELVEVPGVDICAVLPASVDTPIFRQAGNYSGRPVRPIPPTVTPERVAGAIVACAERPQRNKEVVVGRMGHLFAVGSMLVPSAYDRLVGPVMRLLGFGRGETERGPGNVLAPRPELEALTGGWRR